MTPDQLDMDFSRARFDGRTIDPTLDNARLRGQIHRVFICMQDGVWRTLGEIESATTDPQASVSARLRDLRKARFGGYLVNRRRRGEPEDGLFEYQLVIYT